MSDHETMQANGISKIDVHPTMEAAWQELAESFCADLPRRQRESARYCFYRGVQAAANLLILAVGADGVGAFEKAVDQITSDVLAYDKQLGMTLDGPALN